ncbi:MAG: hypothetical protein U0793_09090 [Gemmataceae bacterium]
MKTALAFLFLSVLSTGCGGDKENKPTTYPASGKVFDRAGKPLSSGRVQFQLAGKSENSFGEIGADGSFRLETILSSSKVDGAPEGEHTVTVVTDPKGVTPPTVLKTKYTLKAGPNTDIQVKLE